jgi:hypothetical protein
LTFRGVVAGIPYSHGKARQELQSALQVAQGSMIGQQETKHVTQNVDAWNGLAKLFKECF